jgi:FkbM family methyltransferase
MKELLATFIIKLIPGAIKSRIERPLREKLIYLNRSYGQNGEDILLNRIFADQPTGIFVDIGAHHPIRFSNTYHFYLKGWRGINIDAMPGSMKLFNELRPGDTNLEIGVSGIPGTMDFYVFNEPALNTFDKSEASRKNGVSGFEIVKTIKVLTKPLNVILDESLQADTKIDFMSIDVEGFDLAVLQSNNWNKYQPEVILVELNNYKEELRESETYKYLIGLDYSLISVLYNTLIFSRNEFSANSIIRI